MTGLVFNTKKRVGLLLLGYAVAILGVFLLTPKAHAATLNVVAGNDGIVDNSQCQLSEAISNISDQAQTHDDCPAGDGNNDTINLPTGTITLTADLPVVEKSVTIQGQGMGQTVIDGNDGQYRTLIIAAEEGVENVAVKNLTVKDFAGIGLNTLTVKSVQINQVEIDGSNATQGPPEVGGAMAGILISVFDEDDYTFNVSDVYVHDLEADPGSSPFVGGLAVAPGNNANVNVNISNTTIANIHATGSDGYESGVGILILNAANDGTPSNTTVSVSNTTISNITSFFGATGLTTLNFSTGGDSQFSVDMKNVTIEGIEGQTGEYAVVINGATGGPGDSATSSVSLTNTVLSSGGCFLSNANNGDNVTNSITSAGGNLSTDPSCNDYFTQPTDKKEVSGLADYLGDLTSNGGTVPTIKLLPGNPAIDGGICTDSTPETDARGLSRPQGQTCDSGAYEVEQASPNISQSSGNKLARLITPAGVINQAFSAVTADGLPKDNVDVDYGYPFGLATFTLEVPNNSTHVVSLFYETSLKADQLVPRKYNTANKTYGDIPGAQLANTTVDGKTGVLLTYNLTDNGSLDQNAQAGVIVDPVGLAQENQGLLANTGDFVIAAIPIGTMLIIATIIVTYIDYRKHKRPLLEADKDLAKSYTYWHHLRTVTIPLFSYRLNFAFERRSPVNQNISRFG